LKSTRAWKDAEGLKNGLFQRFKQSQLDWLGLILSHFTGLPG
jgi:hypothetical protein